jgi:hypothetical protein
MAFAEEKDLAVLRGRVDGLEAKVGEIETELREINHSTVLLIDVYDIENQTMEKSAKAFRLNNVLNGALFRRGSNDDSAYIGSDKQFIHFQNSNTSGDWPSKNIIHYGDTSLTGTDLVMGVSVYDGKFYRNAGIIPTKSGSFFVINKQVI